MANKDLIPASTPLTAEQAQLLNQVLPTLETSQLDWLGSFINRLRGVAPVPTSKPELSILFGSESGNAESLADQSAKAANKRGFKTKVLSMADIEPVRLAKMQNLLVIVSTWGEGDPPENAIQFHEAFMAEGAPTLKGLNFSVLGLGDTSYEHFCKMGKDFDARLETLGATRIFARKDCDVDYDDDYAEWLDGTLTALSEATGASTAATTLTPAVTETAAPTVKYSRKNPFPAELKERVLLNGKGSAKETIHLELNLDGSGMDYTVGDALAVIPHNATDVVDALLETTQLNPEEPVSLKAGEFSLREALTRQLDITALSKPVLTRYNEFAQNADLDALLNDTDQLNDYIWGRQIIDILVDFPAQDLDAQQLVSIMRKLPPRLYSIASSPKAHEGEVHLTVGVVRYESQGRARKGVCSSFLADGVESEQTVDVFVSPNKKFRLPNDPQTPIIMVGPGTGIAPFRAFIEERAATAATGKNWLIFGDQHYLTDFLYQSELQSYLEDGVLTKLDVAFSRDQAHKIYVQDRMLENSDALFKWLEAGAVFYVCGDASRMAHDVDTALHTIVRKEGNMSAAQAEDYVQQLKSENRYLRDVY
jgi:sulfite reductase (NADPH) flavoprotein alpha-component